MFGGLKIADKVWKEIIKEVDENSDGKVSFFNNSKLEILFD